MRVALCLSGLARDVASRFPSMKEQILDPFKPDVYCSFWKEGEVEKVKELYTPKRLNLEEVDTDLLDYLHKVYGKPLRPLTEGRLKGLNTLRMFYQIWECNILVDDSYDVVIRARVDCFYRFNMSRWIDPGTVFVPWHKKKNMLTYNDSFAWGDQLGMAVYSDLWPSIGTVAKAMECYSEEYWLHPELALETHLKQELLAGNIERIEPVHMAIRRKLKSER